MSKEKIILLGLNELNFSYIKTYASNGYLPNFKHIFQTYGYKETTSENKYHLLEPWIQWVSLHTGKSFAEHQVFRLGDIVERKNLTQLWEIAEDKGMSVGAISPFNADNRLKNSSFFVPDPWTRTEISGEKFVRQVSKAVSQAVNDNAKGGLTLRSIMSIVKTFLKVVPFSDYKDYFSLVFKIKSRVGVKAVILDKLLADLFIHQWKKYRPDFSTLFLNTGAHIQHHYMFNSIAYEGSLKNPEWYCPPSEDPLGMVLRAYDIVIGKLLKLDVRFFIATGLHQQPHQQNTFYWRLKKHGEFLSKIGIDYYQNVIPRMSRDFLVEFENKALGIKAQKSLESYKAAVDGQAIFTVDNRGNSLFVELTYPNEIGSNFTIEGDKHVNEFKDYIAFVAIKNGEHNGIGYFLDSESNDLPSKFPLTKVFDHIISTFS